MTERKAVTTKEELDTFDSAEIVEGYLDGFNGEPEPGDNRAKAYWHGWRNGHNDRNCKVDAAQRALIRALGVGGKPPATAPSGVTATGVSDEVPGRSSIPDPNQVQPT